MGKRKNSFIYAYFLWFINEEMLSAHSLKCVQTVFLSELMPFLLFFLYQSTHFPNLFVAFCEFHSDICIICLFRPVIVAINTGRMYIACLLRNVKRNDVFVYGCAFSTTTQCTIYCSVELPSENIHIQSEPNIRSKYMSSNVLTSKISSKLMIRWPWHISQRHTHTHTHVFFISSVWFCDFVFQCIRWAQEEMFQRYYAVYNKRSNISVSQCSPFSSKFHRSDTVRRMNSIMKNVCAQSVRNGFCWKFWL